MSPLPSPFDRSAVALRSFGEERVDELLVLALVVLPPELPGVLRRQRRHPARAVAADDAGEAFETHAPLLVLRLRLRPRLGVAHVGVVGVGLGLLRLALLDGEKLPEHERAAQLLRQLAAVEGEAHAQGELLLLALRVLLHRLPQQHELLAHAQRPHCRPAPPRAAARPAPRAQRHQRLVPLTPLASPLITPHPGLVANDAAVLCALLSAEDSCGR